MTGVNMESVLLFFSSNGACVIQPDPVKATSYSTWIRACTAFRCRRFVMTSLSDCMMPRAPTAQFLLRAALLVGIG